MPADLPADLPGDLPVVERDVVRVVVLDDAGQVLLLHTRDLTYPELGLWWELPGGGIEPGEGAVGAAVRELYEETGLTVEPENVGPTRWRRSASFRYHGERRLQHEQVVSAQVAGRAPAVDDSRRVGFEGEDYVGHRWWSPAQIVAGDARFYPGRLPALLPRFLAGQDVEEPFELWS